MTEEQWIKKKISRETWVWLVDLSRGNIGLAAEYFYKVSKAPFARSDFVHAFYNVYVYKDV